MGRIINDRAKNDPYNLVSVIGFGNYTDAFTYVENGFKLTSCLDVTLPLKTLGYREQATFGGYPYVVFFNKEGSTPMLWGIMQCASDVSGFKVGSWGVQMLLGRDH